MNHAYYTLHDFMLHSESITYLLVIATLVGMTLFWLFLTGGKDRKDKD